MNLINRYLQEDNRHTIINSKEASTLVGVDTLDGYHISPGIISDAVIDHYDTAITTTAADLVTVSSTLDQMESRLASLESVSLMGFSAEPIRMEQTPMTAVFQGSEYEIILADGSIIRASNFQIREVRDEEN